MAHEILKESFPCKFFIRKSCMKGAECDFSHDWKTHSDNVLSYYQKGLYYYNSSCSRCQFVNFKFLHSPFVYSETSTSFPGNFITTPLSSSSYSSTPSSSSYSSIPPSTLYSSTPSSSYSSIPPSTLYSSIYPSSVDPTLKPDLDESIENENDEYYNINPFDYPICYFDTTTSCSGEDSSSDNDGNLCSICQKYCLNPLISSMEKEEHVKQCFKHSRHLEALKQSEEIDCSICLERVLSKPIFAERRFGILAECDHTFCITCIRIWRKNASDSDMDNVRLCPVCRKHSHFVIPSVVFFSSKEEKEEIVDNYKAKLRSIDCHYFGYGDGFCQFGAGCFYKEKL
ncbi:E3 ubiquitin-protein ligase makorin [Zostera marina]|uniref:E3 ubiquitin-protein ligase makorin n=1 Tax=Zostera marina TaxID=29655 RepID=A0A0K9P5N9_ZOSMR|nr:E3 ubiquitin-protein ligase makorin [Zostera marina]